MSPAQRRSSDFPTLRSVVTSLPYPFIPKSFLLCSTVVGGSVIFFSGVAGSGSASIAGSVWQCYGGRARCRSWVFRNLLGRGALLRDGVRDERAARPRWVHRCVGGAGAVSGGSWGGMRPGPSTSGLQLSLVTRLDGHEGNRVLNCSTITKSLSINIQSNTAPSPSGPTGGPSWPSGAPPSPAGPP